LRILILEDEGLIALMLTLEIENAGHRVLGPVATVAEALALAAATGPDVALLDVNLGDDAADGIDAAQALLDRHGCRSLFVSGAVDAKRARRAKPWGLLRKPYDPRVLVDTLRTIEAIRAGRESEDRLPGQLSRLGGGDEAGPQRLAPSSGGASS
jgi:DNA-binding response OmpR family regulator